MNTRPYQYCDHALNTQSVGASCEPFTILVTPRVE